MNNCSIIILGATGDLARRKLIPALYDALVKKKMGTFVLIGAAWDAIDAKAMLSNARPFIPDIDPATWHELERRTFYQKVNFTDCADFITLNAMVKRLENRHQLSGNRLIHLAASAHFFAAITQNIAESGLAQRTAFSSPFWHRIVYEKPFGFDINSAREINRYIQASFDENQIYRIDHFLTKELVSNIALIRFTNCVLEPLWNNRFIDAVYIILDESEGIGTRGLYYDKHGALSDVVQNHMLELLALIAMEAPTKLTGDYIRHQRAQVLEKVQFVDGINGQYVGYHQEEHVDPVSRTETFAALLLRVHNPRWAGVPFILKTGKKLHAKETVIYIKFKQVDCLLAKNCPSAPNFLTIRIAPRATFELQLNAKKVGYADEVAPVTMEFCHSCEFGPLIPDPYQVLYEEVIKGEHSISVRFDEIEYAWRVIDQIKQSSVPLYRYEGGTAGPQELFTFLQKHGIRWRT
jgi:glucose-6-phosphate 1-dehydrogenase